MTDALRAWADEQGRAPRSYDWSLIFARSSPEAKLRIADALPAKGTSSR